MSFIFWAPETNYPISGNPWSNTATKVQPGYDFFTPGVPVSAQELNWVFNGFSQTVATAVSSAPANWGDVTSSAIAIGTAGYNVIGCAAWDEFNELWLIASSNGTSTRVAYTVDGGDNWLPVGPPSPPTAPAPYVHRWNGNGNRGPGEPLRPNNQRHRGD